MHRKSASSLAILLLAFSAIIVVTGTPTTAQTVPGSPNQAAAPTPKSNPSPSATPAPGDQYFAETGFTVPAVFMKLWNADGGLPVFGFPISDAHNETSRIDGKDYLVQYFERNRFEYHPEFAGTSNEVLLGLLGAELTKQDTFVTVQPFDNTDGKVYFAETQHSLAEPFLSYWKQNGGLAVFGYPISEVIQESPVGQKPLLVQYFQRNRFEFHPENQPPYNVLLGLLGREFKDAQAAINPWPTVQGGVPVADSIWLPTQPAVGGKFLKGSTVGNGMIVQAFYQDKERILNAINDLNYEWITQQIEWKDTEIPRVPISGMRSIRSWTPRSSTR